MNVLKLHLRTTIDTLLKSGTAHRETERRTGVDRKTIRCYVQAANSLRVATGSEAGSAQFPPPRPPVAATKLQPAATVSAC